MKRATFISLIIGVLLLQGCSILTESRAEREARIERETQMVLDGINSGDFKIDIERMMPLRGSSRHANGFSIKVKDGHIVSNLPYFGRVWDLPYGGGHGLTFEADIEDTAVFTGDDGSYTVRMLIKTDEDTHVYTLQIYVAGNSYLLVQSKNREPINYVGSFSFR